MGPGHYNDKNKDFGYKLPNMKIGEKKYEPILKTLGPGEYSPEKADPLVKSKIKSVLISKSKSRQNSRTPSPRLGPGHYNVNSNDFG